jgi:hypothetical protein
MVGKPVPTTSYTVRAHMGIPNSMHLNQNLPIGGTLHNTFLIIRIHILHIICYQRLNIGKGNYHHSSPERNNYCHTYLVQPSFCSRGLKISPANRNKITIDNVIRILCDPRK